MTHPGVHIVAQGVRCAVGLTAETAAASIRAGIGQVPPGVFEPDDSSRPWHYRRGGYDIYDSVWPAQTGLPVETD